MRNLATLFAAALASAALAGCMAVPGSTASRLAGLNPMEANPSDFRIAVRSSPSFVIGEGSATLRAQFDSADDTLDLDETYLLAIDGETGAAPGIPAIDRARERLVIASITPGDAARLRAFQARVNTFRGAGGKGKGQLSLSASGCAVRPLKAGDAVISAWLQTAPESRFMPLVDKIDMAKVPGAVIPPCGLDAATE